MRRELPRGLLAPEHVPAARARHLRVGLGDDDDESLFRCIPGTDEICVASSARRQPRTLRVEPARLVLQPERTDAHGPRVTAEFRRVSSPDAVHQAKVEAETLVAPRAGAAASQRQRH